MIHLAAKIVVGGEMVNRRSVLKIGAATVAGALVKMPVSGRNLSPERARIAFHRAVFDERFAECRGFAAELHGAGVFTSAIRGDVAELWYDDLRVHLRENRLPVAGLTDRAALFCLEELARDVGMRVIFRADHIIDQNGHTQHTAAGPASLVAVTRSLPPEAGFGRAIAVQFGQFDISGLNISRAGDTSAQKRTGPFSPDNKTALVSWLIA
jgi:TAT (twin-arginine translocation) pathway signal sequence